MVLKNKTFWEFIFKSQKKYFQIIITTRDIIPREEMNLFIDSVDCYMLGKEEYVWKCEYIANILGGMTFYIKKLAVKTQKVYCQFY